MTEDELTPIMRRLATADEPLTLVAGPSGYQLIPADTEIVGTYNRDSTAEEIREDLAEVGEVRKAS